MKILVLSDSHSGMQFMRRAIEAVKPHAVIHLGDYYDDAVTLAEEYPYIPIHCLPGNCDRYRLPHFVPEIMNYSICGVQLYMTHGHRHNVKMGIHALLKDARAGKAQAVLYGHTHIADCHQEADGLWVLNPGSAGYGGGSAGMIEIEDKKITGCRVLDLTALEEMQ